MHTYSALCTDLDQYEILSYVSALPHIQTEDAEVVTTDLFVMTNVSLTSTIRGKKVLHMNIH